MAKFAAAIFDLGNTLVETPFHTTPIEKGSSGEIARFESIVKGTYDSLVNSGIKIDWPSFYEKYMFVRAEQLREQKKTLREYNMGERIASTLSSLGLKISADSESVRNAIERHFGLYESYVGVDKEAPTMLRDLRPRYKLGLISNFAYPPTIYRILEKFHLRQLFDEIVISGEVGWVKPNPRIFRAALFALEVRAQECVFVGDDLEADIRGAGGVGMKTILISQNDIACLDADAVIHHLRELPSVISELERRESQ